MKTYVDYSGTKRKWAGGNKMWNFLSFGNHTLTIEIFLSSKVNHL